VLNDSLKDVSIEFKGKRVATVEYKRVYSNSLQESGRFFVSGGGVQLLPEKSHVDSEIWELAMNTGVY